jgi:hypothetical protein
MSRKVLVLFILICYQDMLGLLGSYHMLYKLLAIIMAYFNVNNKIDK